jgi:chromosome segregation ATPase
VATDRPQRFSREEERAEDVPAELQGLRDQLEAEQAALDEADGELRRRARRIRALEQELNIAWNRVEVLQEELEHERSSRLHRVFRRWSPPE